MESSNVQNYSIANIQAVYLQVLRNKLNELSGQYAGMLTDADVTQRRTNALTKTTHQISLNFKAHISQVAFNDDCKNKAITVFNARANEILDAY